MVQSAKKLIAIALCGALALQQSVFAASPAYTMVEGVKVYKNVKDLALDSNGNMQGVVVNQAGQPLANASVVVGQQGKVVGTVKTNSQGRYQVTGLQSGTYQVASTAGVNSFRVWKQGQQPAGSVTGVVQVVDAADVKRGQLDEDTLRKILGNPVLWGILITTAIVLPIALDDDDAS